MNNKKYLLITSLGILENAQAMVFNPGQVIFKALDTDQIDHCPIAPFGVSGTREQILSNLTDRVNEFFDRIESEDASAELRIQE